MRRIYLSPPHLSGEESLRVLQALESNWVAPVGPEIDAFEQEFTRVVDVPHAAALSSGTAALHLALRLVGVERDSTVLCPTLTFSATANAVVYEGARPVFIDSEQSSWNIDPDLLEEELLGADSRGERPAGVVAVDIYGQSADWGRITELCERFEVPLIEDAAEALGASYRGRPVGGFGRFGVFSFNGNKIITTSGGGMLVSSDGDAIDRARFLASQARDPAPHYEHSEIGFNYRMSNILAAIGRAQLEVLDDRVARRRRNFSFYRDRLADLPGLSFMPETPESKSTRWLSCVLIDPQEYGASTAEVREALERENIEARPVWKPMHLQPVFRGCQVRGGKVAEELFEKGLCLPSGSSLSEEDLERICAVVRSCSVDG
jgi:dTDP-4-amino-4,6-dideoxygalactose transaminase